MFGVKQWLSVAALGAASLTLTGCGGGSSSSPVTAPGNQLVALTDASQLLQLDSRRPGSPTVRNITGLAVGETLSAVDFRFAPSSGAQALFGLGSRAGGVHQLYTLDLSGAGNVAVTPVGPTFTLAPSATAVGFDFNPNVIDTVTGARVDRIRLVTSDGRNLRLNPNNGAVVDSDTAAPGIQLDGNLAYAAGDANAGTAPRVTGAAYTNNDSDIATGTVNYGIDSGTGVLVTQGRPDDPATPANETVSPNTGTLFTVGALGVAPGDGLGFDIVGTNNVAYAAFRPGGAAGRLYQIELTSGRALDLGALGIPAGSNIVGLAALS